MLCHASHRSGPKQRQPRQPRDNPHLTRNTRKKIQWQTELVEIALCDCRDSHCGVWCTHLSVFGFFVRFRGCWLSQWHPPTVSATLHRLSVTTGHRPRLAMSFSCLRMPPWTVLIGKSLCHIAPTRLVENVWWCAGRNH